MSQLKLREVYNIDINGNKDPATLVEVYVVKPPHFKRRITEYVFRNIKGKRIKIYDRSKIREIKKENYDEETFKEI